MKKLNLTFAALTILTLASQVSFARSVTPEEDIRIRKSLLGAVNLKEVSCTTSTGSSDITKDQITRHLINNNSLKIEINDTSRPAQISFIGDLESYDYRATFNLSQDERSVTSLNIVNEYVVKAVVNTQSILDTNPNYKEVKKIISATRSNCDFI